MSKTYSSKSAASNACRNAGLGGMNIRYDTVQSPLTGSYVVVPVVICSLYEDVLEVQKRGFKTEFNYKEDD